MICNIILIPRYAGIGACIGTVLAELTYSLYMLNVAKRDIDIKVLLKNSIPFLLKAILMFIFIYPIKYTNLNDILKIVFIIFMGIIIYMVLNIKYLKSMINIKENI